MKPFRTPILLALVLLAATPAFAEPVPYHPPWIELADAAVPAQDLLAFVDGLRAAAERRDEATLRRAFARVPTVAVGTDRAGGMPKLPRFVFDADDDPIEALIAYTGAPEPEEFDGEDPYEAERLAAEVADPAQVVVEQRQAVWAFFHARLAAIPDWGADPTRPGAICTYRAPLFDRLSVAVLTERMPFTTSAFVHVRHRVEVRATLSSDAAVLMVLEPGRLYAIRAEADGDGGWTSFDLPDGRVGWMSDDEPGLVRGAGFEGLCFAKEFGAWKISGIAARQM